MKTRIKKSQTPALTTRDDAEFAMSNLAGHVNALRKIHADRDAAILQINERCAPHLAFLEEKIKTITSDLEAWATANPAQFPKDRKSLKLACGLLGFRTGTPKLALLSRAFTWEKVLGLVKTYLPGFIRSKPEVDKESILSAYAAKDSPLAEYQLSQCGLKVTQDETFFVEPDLTPFEARQTIPS